ncbi:ribonuclease P protein subunit p25 [Sceloporus undulatus]|uniref:ribonuclease P protein subunit p25 n=1 Tax=Sceloporus undulatus TaxID=8520 RepID=UPI001C4C2228|nr:ribonuclease P protein subunit p25 [Sceloporus undulatus]XP_042333352.1 ribonuclease P protein subunit p25 [Sceloporus undulatus]XP_042333353.1 ribonuclease P protein subunit p25 [Sceloporus undulatus]XP_042333354.1 ribonuclease P protein subunit p25 [Sceloporus undulatus]XP_042333355.1 ribonuclease P protein subunit p25 [Sceloporus undulatus]XP_042333357.1 ribonuclease P protein subunit p25 [Sceloporus undulatus]XP_042333358.1 ribonuclease P protein subunit p25 [Sceloporus undulatus]
MHPGNSEVMGPLSLTIPPHERTSRGAESNTSMPRAPTTATAITQSRMENFQKVKTSEEESSLPFSGLPSDVVEMKVKEGSKIRNLMGFAMGRMALDETRQIVFSGCGRAVTKTITCVEIMKRKLGGLHQVTKVQYKTLLEVWENKDPRPEGQAEHLTVHKNVPSICILLSKDPLDPNQMGYQPPEPPEGLWANEGGNSEDGSRDMCAKGIKRRFTVTQGEDQGSKRGAGEQTMAHREDQGTGDPGGLGDQGGLWMLTMPPS